MHFLGVRPPFWGGRTLKMTARLKYSLYSKMCFRGVISFDKRILFDSCEVRACVTLSKRHKNIRADNTRVSVKSPYFGMNAFSFALA